LNSFSMDAFFDFHETSEKCGPVGMKSRKFPLY
jgi:hypothetical protein